MPTGTTSPTPAGGPTVSYPLPCVGCGYDLVGLAEDGPCPECGVPIGRSISGDHLFASDFEYRRKLARGAEMVHLGAIAGWVAAAAGAVGYAISGSVPFAGWLAVLPLCVAMVLSGWGWAKLAGDDPEGVGASGRRPPEDAGLMLVRFWAFGVIFLAACTATVGATTLLLNPRDTDGLYMAAGVMAAGFVLPALALSGVLARHVGTIARRLLEGDLADRARGLAPAAYATLGFAAAALVVGVVLRGWLPLTVAAWVATAVSLLAWGVVYHTAIRGLAKALMVVARAQ